MKRRTLLAVLGALGLAALGGCKKRESDIPDYGSVGEFSLRDQNDTELGSFALKGKVWIAAFMFTRCPTVCPILTARMKSLQEQAKQRGIEVHFVSISVDPEHDTPAVLRAYAADKGADLGTWHFLTGDPEAIKKTSVEGFKTALEGKADPNKEDFGILHGSHLILVDRELRIRGYFRSKDDAEMKKLLDAASKLAH